MMPSGTRTSPPHRAAGRHVWHLKKDLRLCRKHIFNCSRITFSTPFWAGILLRQAVFSWGNSKSRAFTGSKNTTERLTSGTRNSSTLSDFPPATVSRKGHNHFTLSLKVKKMSECYCPCKTLCYGARRLWMIAWALLCRSKVVTHWLESEESNNRSRWHSSSIHVRAFIFTQTVWDMLSLKLSLRSLFKSSSMSKSNSDDWLSEQS